MADIIDAGDLIAPLGKVLDLLYGKITLSDAQALVDAFADERIRHVEPGDLITSHFFNQVIVDLEELRRRVKVLEGAAGAPRIDRISPSPVVRVGMLVTIEGAGFDPLTETDRIVAHFGDVEIANFTLGSGAGVLKLVLPDSFGVLPRDLTVRVSVGTRVSNALPITVQAPEGLPQGGETTVTLTSSQIDPAGDIRVGSKLTYTWNIVARTVRPDDYKFDLSITNIDGASEADWRANLVVAPTAANIRIGAPQTVTATITVPNGARGARLALDVATNPLIRLNLPAPMDVLVGRPPDVSDPRASVTFDRTSGTFDLVEKVIFEGQELDGLKVARGGNVQIVLVVEPKETPQGSGAGRYTYEAEVEGHPAGWDVDPSPKTTQNLPLGQSRQLTVQVTNSEAAGAGTTRMVRVWARHSTAAGAASDFAGFHRFPVQAQG